MKRNLTRKPTIVKKKQRQQEPETITPLVKLVTNPASQSKIDLYLDKRSELESVLQIKQRSDELKNSSSELYETIKVLSECAKNVSDVLSNWEGVFSVMGDSNIGKMKNTDKWVRYVKPVDNERPEVTTDRR